MSTQATPVRHTGKFEYTSGYSREELAFAQESHDKRVRDSGMADAVLAAIADGRMYIVSVGKTVRDEPDLDVVFYGTTIHVLLVDPHDAEVGESVLPMGHQHGRPSFSHGMHNTTWTMAHLPKTLDEPRVWTRVS
jgi:hypothetical protein